MSNSSDAEWHHHYHVMNAVIWCSFVYMVLLMLVQFCVAPKWYNRVRDSVPHPLDSSRLHTLCNYGFYLAQILCAGQCFLAHISYIFDDVYCIVGTPICAFLYGAGRCFLYGIFLERVKDANHRFMSFRSLPPLMFTIISYYIAFYFLMSLIMVSISFRGKLVTDSNGAVTSCHFDDWISWVPVLATIGDVFNTLLFFGLFVSPLYLNHKHKVIQDAQKKKEFVDLMAMNVIFSTVCCITSMMAVVMVVDPELVVEYIWLIANVDMIINATAVFILYDPSRQYVKHLMRKLCCQSEKQVNTVQMR